MYKIRDIDRGTQTDPVTLRKRRWHGQTDEVTYSVREIGKQTKGTSDKEKHVAFLSDR
jgi:hypothetical protein